MPVKRECNFKTSLNIGNYIYSVIIGIPMFLKLDPLNRYSNIEFTDDKSYFLISVAMVVSYGHLTQFHP